MPVPETEVLKPREASLHENHWAEFVLSDASVVYESDGRPASLLLAFPDTPLRVQGRLITPSREHYHYLQKKPYKPTKIVLHNVTRYAYAEMADRTYAIWALGEAGYFEMQPAAHYKATYDDMVQAVEILYFVTDVYNEPRKKGGGPTANLIYQENDFERCKARHEGRVLHVKPDRPSRTTETSSAPSAATPASGRAPSGSKVATKKTDAPPKKDDNWWEAATLFEFMQKAVNQRVIRAGRNSITIERVAQLLIKRFEIDHVATARNVLLVHAQNLCYMMDHPRRQNIRFFAAEPVYGELAAGHSLSAAEQRRAEGVELRPRKNHGTLRGDSSESSDTSDDEDEDVITTPRRRLPGRSKKGTLSVLRPKSAQFSGKGKSVHQAGKGKTNPPIPVSDSDADSTADEDDAMAIDTPTQTLSPGASKRKLSDLDSLAEGKRARAASSPTSPSSPPTSPGDETPEPGTADPPLPLRYHSAQQKPGAKLTQPVLPALVSSLLPTYEPNGPRDSWICSFDGCSQRIYGCSKEIGRQLVTEHLEDHTKGREKVVGILWREEERLQLPVSNLIKKIREMSEAKTPLLGPGGGEERPQAVRRAA
ncbi:hypothetical protein G6514_001510 [Epicoccum nigrum]|nr:hypothetical protein G6514_001510 [Epicoccum nigrum]